ncbi:MAG TPA: hypothetical protein VK809_02445 [Bacteroidia bacterium]|jgi:hypothetical protein|nr:hypothetical protein [Bacteroidia bacterium]
MAVTVESKNIGIKKFEKQKNTLAKKVLSIKDEDTVRLVLYYIEDLNSTKRITKAQYNKEIEEAEKRVKAGKFVTNEQVMKEMKKW